MIEALIFDLDNCLAPAMEIGTEPYRPALEAIEEANFGTLSSNALEAAINDIWSHPFDWVADTWIFNRHDRSRHPRIRQDRDTRAAPRLW